MRLSIAEQQQAPRDDNRQHRPANHGRGQRGIRSASGRYRCHSTLFEVVARRFLQPIRRSMCNAQEMEVMQAKLAAAADEGESSRRSIEVFSQSYSWLSCAVSCLSIAWLLWE